MVADRYGEVQTALKFSDESTVVCERPKRRRLTPDEIAEQKLAMENIRNARNSLSPEESRQVSIILSGFKKATNLTTAGVARKIPMEPKKLRRLLKDEQVWKVGDVVKLEQAFPYWKDLIQKPINPVQGSFCPDCGSNKTTVERTGTDFATGLGREDVILERRRKCVTPNCGQVWSTWEISKKRFQEIVEQTLIAKYGSEQK
tara:strand:+ start:1286 stop:1891 length:606 start_codon:yes stop_codon:yes gene_type:complete